MTENDFKLLDCTLRDGGYINNWNWGYQTARELIQLLVKSKVDIVEVGFLRNVEDFNPDITVSKTIEELNGLLPNEKVGTIFSAMAMRSNYDIENLSDYCGYGIELIRVTAHDYDIEDGLEFAGKVKEKGYKVSINPINIMGYSDADILKMLEKVNRIQPYQFAIVDTFGSMKRRDLDRIVSLVDNNLERSIRVALHLHENMALSCSLAQNFIDKHLQRPISIDGSLMGMGRTPGNLPLELIADYLNDVLDRTYDIDYMMDAIQDYIAPLKGDTSWGYLPAYFLSARFNLHRNYAEHYLNKGNLTNRDINKLLSRIPNEKATVFDLKLADFLYEEFMGKQVEDLQDRNALQQDLQGNSVLIMAPGATIKTHKKAIRKFIEYNSPKVISINFIPEEYEIDYCFFSNNKRYDKLYRTKYKTKYKTIVTSNLSSTKADYTIDYNSLLRGFSQGCNGLLMLLTLLNDLKIDVVYIAGADGYSKNKQNYYQNNMRNYTEHDEIFNSAVSEAIRNIGITTCFLTPSEYEVL